MTLYLLLAIGFIYLFVLFCMAYLTERGFIPEKLVQHPLVFTLSIGVYASAWAVYGVIGFAYQSGYNFIAYFFGVSGAFILAPVMIHPILRLSKAYQLSSLADLFTYRYRSKLAGSLVAAMMMLALLPLIALQIQAVAESIAILTQSRRTQIFAAIFVGLIILFTTLFGARHATSRERHPGLVIAIAFETLIKVTAMLILAGFSLFHLFGGFNGLEAWLVENPHALEILYAPIEGGPWRTLLLPFFLSVLTMPHMYHMIFTERPSPKAVRAASWGFPLIMLMMAITVPIIMWGAIKAGVMTDPEYFALGLGLSTSSPAISVTAFLAGLSAASGVMIVVTLSLAITLLNHLVLPFHQPTRSNEIYYWLLKVRRILIVTILTIAYLFYLLLDGSSDLTELGLLAFVGTLQFAPGLIGVIFWPRATKFGFIAGLCIGFSLWIILLLMPMLSGDTKLGLIIFNMGYTLTIDNWQIPALISTFMNTLAFVLGSIVSKQSNSERSAALSCTINNLKGAYQSDLAVTSTEEFSQQLTKHLGEEVAKKEVSAALTDLQLNEDETRPYALRRLRDQIEANLSGLFGSSVAQEIVEECLPYKSRRRFISNDDIHFIESRVETYHNRLTGLAKELDNLRRFHRQVINDLPIGVCSLASISEIVSWNRALEDITNIPGEEAIGCRVWHLQPPWGDLISEIVQLPEADIFTQRELLLNGDTRHLNIYKAIINTASKAREVGNLVLVIEDVTEFKMLESKIAHNERLAAIGKLAAGVAHEIGNPITGIACLAQDIGLELDEPIEQPHPEEDLSKTSMINTFIERDATIKQMAQQILHQTERVSNIVQSLVKFSHSGQSELPTLSSIQIHSVVEESINLIKLNPDASTIQFINDCPTDLYVQGNRQLLVQVFINLLSNASDASPTNGEITITAYQNSTLNSEQLVGLRSSDKLNIVEKRQVNDCTKNHGFVTISVIDHGTGIPKKIIPNVFDPFVTTKSPGKGTGLGLALVYRIIADHKGSINITSPISSQEMGTKVSIHLPKLT